MLGFNTSKKKKLAVVAEGGGFRNIFSAGVFDAFISSGFDPFDIYIGVSGGAMVLSSFVAKQFKRSAKIITKIAAHPDFLSAKRYIAGGDYLGLDVLLDIDNKVYPFDFDTALKNIRNKDFVIVCTDVDSGQPVYMRPDKSNWTLYLKASGALPILTRKPVVIHEKRVLDGALSSPLPVARAVEMGARKIIVVRTRPVNFQESNIESNIEGILSSYLYRELPMVQKVIKDHANIYNRANELMQNPPKDIEIIQIAPEEPLESSIAHQTTKGLIQDYRYGLELGIDLVNQQD